jgi:hypothetical protein
MGRETYLGGVAQLEHAVGGLGVLAVHAAQHHDALLDALGHGRDQVEPHLVRVVPK